MIRTPGIVFAGAVSALLAFVLPAEAFSLFGIEFFGSKDAASRTDIIDPKAYDVTFTVTRRDELADSLKGASQLWVQREEPASGSAGLLAMAKGDYRRILAALYDQGYYGGSISITVDGSEASAIAVGSSLPDRSAVVITVNPGPQFLFARTMIENAAPAPTDARDAVKSPASEGFARGEPARATTIRKAGALSVSAWRQQGHAKAEIDERRVTANHSNATLNVELHVRPGPVAYYGPVTVRGTTRMDPEFVRWMLGIEPGREYDPDDLEKGLKRLQRLEVFSTQAITEADRIGDDGLLPLTLSVSERKRRRIGLGATLSTTEGLGVEAFWLHRNLFGRAESLKITGKASGIGQDIQFDEIDYSLGALFRKPGVIDQDTNFVASLTGVREFVDPYTKNAVDGSVGLEHFFSDRLSARAAIFAEHGKFKDAFGKRKFTMVGLDTGLTLDHRDNKLDPAKGFFADIEARPFEEFNYGNTAIRAVADLRAYRALAGTNRLIAAARVKAGVLGGSSIAETPPDMLFLAGGGGSVRGYGYKTIGVAGPGGQTVGGRSLLEMSGEMRFRVTDAIGIVGFVDTASVGTDSFSFASTDFKTGTGLGLRYYTGLGPIRLDVGIPLNRGKGDPSFAIYAGIGQAF